LPIATKPCDVNIFRPFFNIRFTESALEEGSEEEKELRKNVKRVMEVIVGLLKDRVDVEKEPATKKQQYFEK